MSSSIGHLILGGLAGIAFIYSSYYLYSIGKITKKKKPLESSKYQNNKNSKRTNESDDLGSSEINFLVTSLTSNNNSLLQDIIITISKLAAYNKNHEILRKHACVEKLHELVQREWTKWKLNGGFKEEMENDIVEGSSNELDNGLEKPMETTITQALMALSNLAMNEAKLPSLNEILKTCQEILHHPHTPPSITTHILIFLLNATAAHADHETFKIILPYLNQHIFPTSSLLSPSSPLSSSPPNPITINSLRITTNLSTHPPHAFRILNFQVSSEAFEEEYLQNQHNDLLLRYTRLLRSLISHLNSHNPGSKSTDPKTLFDLIMTKNLLKKQIECLRDCDERVQEVLVQLETSLTDLFES